ncbi:hypothetical protein GW17_00046155 [Ensete ventricosum]|nr:hypothetical protein GW17_00046155 [Ensete ventricosum]
MESIYSMFLLRLMTFPLSASITQYCLKMTFIYADSVEETSSSSEVEESSPNVQPIIPKDLESSTESSSSSAYGNSVDRAPSLCIAVVGATGELARSKIFPALFALYYSGFLPELCHLYLLYCPFLQNVGIFGYSRKDLSDEDLRNMIAATLTCRVDHQYVKVLRSIRKLNLDDVVLGQYKNSADKSSCYMNSLTPTFFAAALYIDNARLNVILCLFLLYIKCLLNRAVFIRYNVEVPDSYEHLLLDVIDGDNHLFMRSDELEAAWNILTPILDKIEENKVVPELYEVGGRGPVGSYYLGANHGVRWADD